MMFLIIQTQTLAKPNNKDRKLHAQKKIHIINDISLERKIYKNIN